MSPTNLLLTGGIAHPFAQTSALIAGHLAQMGVRSEIVSVRDGLARLRETQFDLLTLNALAFTMVQHEKYASLRVDHAFAISAQDKAAIEAHLARGGRLLGLHTAAICFDDWPEWKDLLGVAWQWGTSYHPEFGAFAVSGKIPFETRDELYCDMALAADAEVLATATCDGVDRAQPVLIRRANAAYLALGHDQASIENPGYVRLLSQAVQSLLTSQERGA